MVLTRFDCDHGISSLADTLGGPDVTHVFVHSTRSLPYFDTLTTVLPGFHKYADRALVAARPDDVVCVADPVEEAYLDFLGDLGIGPRPGNIVALSSEPGADKDIPLPALALRNERALERIATLVSGGRSVVINPYITSPEEVRLASRLESVLGRPVTLLGGDPVAVEYADSKPNMRAKALQLGVPVAPGEIVELAPRQDGGSDPEPVREAIARYVRRTGRVVVRGAHGASGSATHVIEDDSTSAGEVYDAIRGHTHADVYLVEVMLDVAVSPNIQMYLDPEGAGVSCVGISDQRLVATVSHAGNVYPSTATTIPHMMRDAYTLSSWLRASGCTGIVGFDFGEYVGGEDRLHFLIEVNPRINAATYPRFLMEHLNRGQARDRRPGIEAFRLANVKTNAWSFAEVARRYGHLFFRHDTGQGIVPFNMGCLKYGKFSAVIFGSSRDEVLRLYAEVTG